MRLQVQSTAGKIEGFSLKLPLSGILFSVTESQIKMRALEPPEPPAKQSPAIMLTCPGFCRSISSDFVLNESGQKVDSAPGTETNV